MFSVVIPLYNKSKSIRKTIDCVLAQSFPDFELVVVNDGSKDDSAAIVATYTDKRIRLIDKPNGGVSSARNRGIKEATQPYVAFLDADDLWQNNYLERMAAFIRQHPGCDIYASSYMKQIDGKLYPPNKNMAVIESGVMEDYFAVQRVNFYPLVWTSAVVARKDRLEEVGMFDERLSLGEDLDVWYRLILNGKLAYLNEPLAIYCETQDDRLTARLNADKHILFYLDKYQSFENSNNEFKRYLDKYRLESLRQYYIEGKNRQRVAEVLNKVDAKEFGLFYTLYYKIIPLPLLQSGIKLYKSVKK